MQKKAKDTCTTCGAEDVLCTFIDDVDRVCDTCLDNDFQFCDICEEYWSTDAVEFTELNDGRMACENCAEDLEEEEE